MTAAIFPTNCVRPSHTTYVRRRLIVGLVFVAVVAIIAMAIVGVVGSNVLADRGDVPASIPAIRPAAGATAGAGSAGSTTHVVHAGDTLWSLAEVHHGGRPLLDYVDALIAVNGGTSLHVGQQLTLP